MHVTVTKGRIDRIFFNTVERQLYLKMENDPTIHTLRVSDNSMFRASIMLTKPGDLVVIHNRTGHIDKWENVTMAEADKPATELAPAD